MSSSFDASDLASITARGSDPEKIERQLAILRQPPRPIRLERPCTVGDGITRLDHERTDLERAWHEAIGELEQLVPASGAATRMFAFLPAQRGSGVVDRAALERRADGGDTRAALTLELLRNLGKLPFTADLETLAGADRESLTAVALEDPGLVLELLADASGLDLAGQPKGLLPFHRYDSETRSAFEEQVWAAAPYLSDGSVPARLHFTVAAEHESRFREAARRLGPLITGRLGVDFDIDFSLQDPATDTIAIEADGSPVRCADTSLLFRPGGHGSLLLNLERLARRGSPIVFIKNIDNIALASRQPELARWKKALAGHLLLLRRRTFDLLARLEERPGEPGLIEEAARFLYSEFALDREATAPPASLDEAALQIRDRLDRPLRVCGVVVNRGEPGGGPFWIQRDDGSVDGQIVEGSQIDRDDTRQLSIWSSSTHFNPVDIVCSLHDRAGNPYDLERFVDQDTYFVATKPYDGRTIKVLERPGLWNGAMAGWNTAFIEVPEETFTPVKTLLDLLRPAHQS